MNKKAFCKAFTLFVFLSVFPNWSYCQTTGFNYSLNLTSLSFSGDGIVPIRDDNNKKFYDAPHWLTTERKPVCYVSGSKPKIACLFEITGVCTNKIYVKGEASNGMVFIQQQLTINANNAVYPLTEADIEFSLGKVDMFDDFTIDWYMSNTGTGKWAKIGASKNTMYVTKNKSKRISVVGDKRLADNNYATFHTTLYIGCKYGKDKITDKLIVDNVYNYFMTKNVESVENKLCMQFWGKRVGNGVSGLSPNWAFFPIGLIREGDGKCQAWAYFFLEIMRTQGIDGVTLQTMAWKRNELLDSDNITLLRADLLANNFITDDREMSTLKAYFFIKNWSSPNIFTQENYNYVPGQTIASGDGDGLEGQCMANPWSIFYSHLLVEYDGVIYDPSYGSTPAATKQVWQGNNVAYFGTYMRIREKDERRGQTVFKRYYWLKTINQNDIIDKNIEPYIYPY